MASVRAPEAVSATGKVMIQVRSQKEITLEACRSVLPPTDNCMVWKFISDDAICYMSPDEVVTVVQEVK